AVVHGDLVVADDPVVCAASGRLPTLFVSGSAARSDAGGRLVDLAGHLHADHPGERLRLPATDAATAGDRVTALDLVLRSEEHTSELQSRENLVCRLLLENTNITA